MRLQRSTPCLWLELRRDGALHCAVVRTLEALPPFSKRGECGKLDVCIVPNLLLLALRSWKSPVSETTEAPSCFSTGSPERDLG